jgi:ribosomal protein S18 acetylase RimI-like enzyme
MKIELAETADQFNAVRRILQEYAKAEPDDPALNSLKEELSLLEQIYVMPQGQMLMAHQENDPAGCVALRPLDGEVCEMRQLYVSPRYRNSGVGRGLVMTLLIEAEKAGFRKMRLQVDAEMKAAQELYESIGFRALTDGCEQATATERCYEIDFGPAP